MLRKHKERRKNIIGFAIYSDSEGDDEEEFQTAI